MLADYKFVETDSAKLYTDIIGSLMEACDEPLYPGDERRVFGESLVAVFTSLFNLFDDRAKQTTLAHARGVVLDALGARYRVKRAAPAPASATFRFTVSTALDENIVIPAGTRITTDGTVYFATAAAVVLEAGTMYIDAIGVCSEGGAYFNGFAPGTIATLVDLIPFVSGAENTTTSAGGDDGEPYTEDGDNRYRERIRLAPAAFSPGTLSGYTFHALSTDPDISAVEIDCPEDEPNTVNIYALMKGGVLPDDATLQKILDTIDQSNVRIMTDNVTANAPEIVAYSIQAKYYCHAENVAAVIEAIEGDGGAIDQYIAWQSARMGRNVSPDELRKFLYNSGAVMVDVTSPVRADVTKTQVAKLSGTPVITYEVVSG